MRKTFSIFLIAVYVLFIKAYTTQYCFYADGAIKVCSPGPEKTVDNTVPVSLTSFYPNPYVYVNIVKHSGFLKPKRGNENQDNFFILSENRFNFFTDFHRHFNLADHGICSPLLFHSNLLRGPPLA